MPLCAPTPFGVAEVLSCNNEGDLELQWLTNNNDEPRGMFKPGWTPAPHKLDAYYEQEQKHASHLPYRASDDNIVMNQRDVLLHSFELTMDQRLPPALIKAISNPHRGQNPGAPCLLKPGSSPNTQHPTPRFPLVTRVFCRQTCTQHPTPRFPLVTQVPPCESRTACSTQHPIPRFPLVTQVPPCVFSVFFFDGFFFR